MSPQPVKASTYDDIARAYENANGPFEMSIDGKPSFIVMRASDLEEEAPLSDAEIQILKRGYEEAVRGETRDAFESLAEIRAAYGL